MNYFDSLFIYIYYPVSWIIIFIFLRVKARRFGGSNPSWNVEFSDTNYLIVQPKMD